MNKINVDAPNNPDPNNWTKRVLVFTPTTGTVRMEWVSARYGQIVPTNWSHVELIQWLSSYVPIGYQLADAQNLMAKTVVEHDYDWVLYIEHDNIVPKDLFIRMNEYMRNADIPVVSGLYFTKGYPCEPLLYRGRGTSYYTDWKIGDKVWVDGIPFGCRLEHAGLIKEAWKISPEYNVGNETTRRVFQQPTHQWYDPQKGGVATRIGTTDLEWCTRIINDKLLEKAGFPEIQKKEFPFLVDTNIFVEHIDNNGVKFPTQIPPEFIPYEKSEQNNGQSENTGNKRPRRGADKKPVRKKRIAKKRRK